MADLMNADVDLIFSAILRRIPTPDVGDGLSC
jgi:hypothetical protein